MKTKKGKEEENELLYIMFNNAYRCPVEEQFVWGSHTEKMKMLLINPTGNPEIHAFRFFIYFIKKKTNRFLEALCIICVTAAAVLLQVQIQIPSHDSAAAGMSMSKFRRLASVQFIAALGNPTAVAGTGAYYYLYVNI